MPAIRPPSPQLTSLKAVKSLRQLAPLLGLKPAVLAMQLYTKDKRTAWYTSFDIKKRYGGVRTINAPEMHLKMIQSRLSKMLQDCDAEIHALKGRKEGPDHPGIAHGFKRYHTIMTNGREHVRKRFVFNVDLEDFFGSFHFGRVRAFFEKNKDFKLDPKIAEILAHIVCYKGGVPQGSPCSPVISNLIAGGMDTRLAALARDHGLTYTRYADDLTFSTNLKEFPAEVAERSPGTHDWIPGKSLVRIVSQSGFSFNSQKTRMQYRDSRQEVTGLTVNAKINVGASYRYRTRAMVDRLFATGSFSFDSYYIDATGARVEEKAVGSLRQLLGRLTHIDQVDRFNEALREKHGLPKLGGDGRLKLFRDFLYYFNFYAVEQPVIVCEGKTDNVYLRCAIKAKAAAFVSLISGAPPELKVKFFKYTDRRTSSVIGLSGGVGGVCKLIKHYYENHERWHVEPRPAHPVIIVIDNDSGSNSVYEAIAGITKKPKPAGRAPFIHVVGNLYVVPTPPVGAKRDTDIECLFHNDALDEKLSGKSFNKHKEIDTGTEYGKAAFALNVVAKKSGTLNFDGFIPLLQRIEAAIADYRARA